MWTKTTLYENLTTNALRIAYCVLRIPFAFGYECHFPRDLDFRGVVTWVCSRQGARPAPTTDFECAPVTLAPIPICTFEQFIAQLRKLFIPNPKYTRNSKLISAESPTPVSS